MESRDDILDQIRALGAQFDAQVGEDSLLSPQGQVDLYKKHFEKMLCLSERFMEYHNPRPSYPVINEEKELNKSIPKLTAEYVGRKGWWDSKDLEKQFPDRFNVGHPWIYDSAGNKVEVEVVGPVGRTRYIIKNKE